jgi:dihydrofolate reductase
MRPVVMMMSVSLDGFMEGPGGDLSWHRVDAELHQHFNELLRDAGAFLDGRRTWDLMASYWPTADQQPDSPPDIAEFAAIWRDKPKVVYSRTLTEAGWGTTIVREVDPSEIEEMKAAPGGDLFLGGADLAATFIRLGLVDEYRIYVHPVIVGAGTRPLPPLDDLIALELVESRTFGNGVVLLRYRRAMPSGGAGD